MRVPSRCLSTAVCLVALCAALAAKGETAKIIISGGDLAAPVEMHASVVKAFQIWSGPGTQQCFNGRENCVEGGGTFIVDWSSGEVAQRPSGLPHYEIAFYVTDARVGGSPSPERLAYVVDYEYDPATARGYVYLPGKGDQRWQLNVASIYRGREGHWYRATQAWLEAVTPLLARR